jgi:hypothetical protein
MIPIAKPFTAAAAPLPARKTVFRIFQDERAHWCARATMA